MHGLAFPHGADAPRDYDSRLTSPPRTRYKPAMERRPEPEGDGPEGDARRGQSP